MTCSWQGNWISNTKGIYFCNVVCDHNVPYVRQIEPGKNIIYIGIICVDEAVKPTKESGIKLGCILIKEKEVLELLNFRKVLSNKMDEQKDIIWSDAFKIN